MSLNVKSINVGGTDVTLRLTSKALLNFTRKHGAAGQSPVLTVLSAIDDIEARIDLLTNALKHPENNNRIGSGSDLLDLMADDWSWPPEQVNVLILDLANESGLLSDDDYSSLLGPVRQNGKNLISKLAALLSGKPIGAGSNDDSANAETAEENPT